MDPIICAATYQRPEFMGACRIVGICGSLRAASLNAMLLRVAARIARAPIEIELYRDIGKLPLFNPDLEPTDPAPVAHLRGLLVASDAVLIASPEYAHGVSGVIKNALDWMVGNESFVNKPVGLFNTSPRATHAQAALRETLQTMSARIVAEACIALPLLGSRLTAAEVLQSDEWIAAVSAALEALASGAAVEANETNPAFALDASAKQPQK